jgi:hypothetical protein
MDSKAENDAKAPTQDPAEDSGSDTLNDLIDRIGRESFQRALQRRTLRIPEPLIPPHR